MKSNSAQFIRLPVDQVLVSPLFWPSRTIEEPNAAWPNKPTDASNITRATGFNIAFGMHSRFISILLPNLCDLLNPTIRARYLCPPGQGLEANPGASPVGYQAGEAY